MRTGRMRQVCDWITAVAFPRNTSANIGLTATPPTSTAPPLPAIQPLPSVDQPSSTSPQLGDASLTPESAPSARQSSQLSMIAASANEMVPQNLTLDQENGGLGQDGLPRVGSTWPNQPLSSSEQLLFESLQEHDPSLTSAAQRAATFPRPIAMNPSSHAKGFVNEFGNSTKPTKPKVRGRFSATRRREVQEVRKRGACIRCRMLKKPVRGDLPSPCCGDPLYSLTDLWYSALAIAPAVRAVVSRVLGSGNNHASAPELPTSSNSTMLVSHSIFPWTVFATWNCKLMWP